MTTQKPTFLLTPPRPYPPDGPIRLGAIIPSPTQPDEPLHLPPLPSSSDTSSFTEKNWRRSHIKSSSSRLGIWTSFLAIVLGAGADISVGLDKEQQQSWDVERMTTQTFFPSSAFIEEAISHEDVKRYITEYRFREKIYIITGVMIASSTKMSTEQLEEKGIYVRAGVDATAWGGVPISVGPEGKWKCKNNSKEESERAEVFVFAYRIREVKVGRKGGIKANRLYDKGALFDAERKKTEEERYEVEFEGLGEEVGADDVGLESREVVQEFGERTEEECVCVLPEMM